MNVTVAEVLAGAEVRAVPLSAECVGYLVLAAADQVSAAPRRLEPNDVLLFEDGGIRVASGRAADGSLAERDLRAVLDALLVRASAPTSGLLRASRRAPGGGVEALVRELETALIPVNRSAAKRSLARLERETVRALQSGRISVPAPSVQTPEPAPSTSAAPERPATRVAPPPPAVPEIPELSVAPPAATLHERSTVPPPVASVAPRRSEPHEPVAAPVSMLPPPLEETEILDLPVNANEATAGETVVLAPVGPKNENDPQLVETRPEPVVQRASARPPAPPAELPSAPQELVRTEPLTFVRTSTAVGAEPLVKTPPNPAVAAVPAAALPAVALPVVALESGTRPQLTPVLGTRVQSESELPPLVTVRLPETATVTAAAASAHEARADDAELEFADDIELELEFDDDGDVDVLEVHFDSNPPAAEPPALAEASELTEPCPPLEAESLLPPPLVEPEPEPEPEPVASAPMLEESIPLAVMLETKWPPVVTQSVAPEVLTPLPRVALPKPRPSDVADLLQRLEAEPLSDAELRAGLRNLAGMEPTPPPPGLKGDS